MRADADAEIMLRLQAGEDTALNEIMTRWQTPPVSFMKGIFAARRKRER